jgi:hypothetical protein
MKVLEKFKKKKRRDRRIISSFEFFFKKRLLFIHIPKTAGITIYDHLFGKDSFGHYSIIDYERNVGIKKVNGIYKAAIVRNPKSRCLSAYNYLINGGRGKKIDLEYQQRLSVYSSFNDFVLRGLLTGKEKDILHFIPQFEMLCSKQKNKIIGVDYIGHFEELEKAVSYIGNKIDAEVSSLPTKNVTNLVKNPAPIISEECENALKEYYYMDYYHFNFER